MFGINAPETNRVEFQQTLTCAVIVDPGYIGREVNGTYYYYLGPTIQAGELLNYTYAIDKDITISNLDYLLV
jgi:hypothetical protein